MSIYKKSSNKTECIARVMSYTLRFPKHQSIILYFLLFCFILGDCHCVFVVFRIRILGFF